MPPDASITAPDFCAPRRGRTDVERIYRNLFETYPGIRAEVHEFVAEGDQVAVRLTIRSKTPAATFDVALMNFFTVRNGLIQSDDGLFDNGGRRCTP